jgi:hypothetical protein
LVVENYTTLNSQLTADNRGKTERGLPSGQTSKCVDHQDEARKKADACERDQHGEVVIHRSIASGCSNASSTPIGEASERVGFIRISRKFNAFACRQFGKSLPTYQHSVREVATFAKFAKTRIPLTLTLSST